MNKINHELDGLPGEILEALTQLDLKGTDETVTRAISIVYEGFNRYESRHSFKSADLLKSTLNE